MKKIKNIKKVKIHSINLSYLKSIQDIKKGNYKIQTAKEHIEELKNELSK
jgi:hypothetical protein